MPKGGARPKAGRPPKPAGDKTEVKSFTLPMDVVEHLKLQENASQYVTALIRQDMKKQG